MKLSKEYTEEPATCPIAQEARSATGYDEKPVACLHPDVCRIVVKRVLSIPTSSELFCERQPHQNTPQIAH